jgi:hypothetical protein
VEVFIVVISVSDAQVVEYVSVAVSVSVSVSTLKMLLHDCDLNWRRFSLGCYSVSASSRKHILGDRGSPYVASQVEQGLSSLKV